jgi:hemolysin III
MTIPRFISAHAIELRARPAEIVNSITHGAGLLLSIPACAALLIAAWNVDGPYQLCAIGLYAFGFIGTYAASTASHLFHAGSINRWLRMLDQGFIYLFIAGTYTPLMAPFLMNERHYWLLAAVWATAIFGFVTKTFFASRIYGVSTGLYLALGWIPAIGLWDVILAAPSDIMGLVAAGGVCYTIGVYFLLRDDERRHDHAVWHLLVMAASAFHFVAIWLTSLRVA